MTKIAPSDTPPATGLVELLDHALQMVMDHLTSEQRAQLREKVEEMDLAGLIGQQCSAELQNVLLNERPRVNPDGGRVGGAGSEHSHRNDGSTVEEGSAE